MSCRMQIYSEGIPSMTTRLEVSIVWPEEREEEAHALIQKGFGEAQRLINIISAWQEDTELYAVNSAAGKGPVKVSDELFYLVQRANKISGLTNGLFDVSFASIDKVWYFDKPMHQMPAQQEIESSIRNIGYKFIRLDEKEKTIYITNTGTKIELGAIGKGYIANKIKALLQASGVTGGLVNAGGDLITWGKNERGETWRVGIADPEKKEKYIAWIPLENQAAATSGGYERYALINGEKYSHIIHPHTGYPVKGIHSVTVICPDAELSDAIATSVFLLGVDEGLDFINRFNDLQCFIIDDHNQYHYSENLKKVSYGKMDA